MNSGGGLINLWMIILSVVAVVLVIVLFYLSKSEGSNRKSKKSELKDIKIPRSQKRALKKAEKAAVKKAAAVSEDIQVADPRVIADETLNDIISKVKASFEKKVDHSLENKLNNLNKSIDQSIKKTEADVSDLLSQYYLGAKQSVEKSVANIDQEALKIDASVKQIVDERKKDILAKVDSKMINILTAYLNETLVGAIDLADQQEYIFDRLNSNKEAILEDIKNVSV